MANCGPASAVPSCEATPTVAFGSRGSRGFGYGYGLGSGFGFGSGYGLGTNIADAASLGVLSGVHPSCINQIPSSEAVIDPVPIAVVMPGAILSATPEPLLVGGNTPCAVDGVGLSGLGFSAGHYGGYYGGLNSGLYGSLNSGLYCGGLGSHTGFFGSRSGFFGRRSGFLGNRAGFLGRRSSFSGPCV